MDGAYAPSINHHILRGSVLSVICNHLFSNDLSMNTDTPTWINVIIFNVFSVSYILSDSLFVIYIEMYLFDKPVTYAMK